MECLPERPSRDASALLQGTLDLLILRTLVFGPAARPGHRAQHRAAGRTTSCWSITARSTPRCSGSKRAGWIDAEWGTSENNRKARFYTLTKAGRKQLAAQTQQWRRLAAAIGRVLGPEGA